MHNQNMMSESLQVPRPKNRISTIVGVVVCVILVILSVVLEIVVIRDILLRTLGEVYGWDASGFIIFFELIPMLIVAAVVSVCSRKKAVGAIKEILRYLRPATILIGGLVVIPLIGVVIVALSATLASG